MSQHRIKIVVRDGQFALKQRRARWFVYNMSESTRSGGELIVKLAAVENGQNEAPPLLPVMNPIYDLRCLARPYNWFATKRKVQNQIIVTMGLLMSLAELSVIFNC